jgi:hypothetical protein
MLDESDAILHNTQYAEHLHDVLRKHLNKHSLSIEIQLLIDIFGSS